MIDTLKTKCETPEESEIEHEKRTYFKKWIAGLACLLFIFLIVVNIDVKKTTTNDDQLKE